MISYCSHISPYESNTAIGYVFNTAQSNCSIRHLRSRFGFGLYTLGHAALLSSPRIAASALYFGLGNVAFENAGSGFFSKDAEGTLPRGESTLTSPLAGTQGIALAVKNFTTAQGFAIGAVVGLVNAVPQAAWDLTDRVYSLEQQKQRLGKPYSEAQTRLKSLIKNEADNLRELIERYDVKSLADLDNERIAEDNKIRNEVIGYRRHHVLIHQDIEELRRNIQLAPALGTDAASVELLTKSCATLEAEALELEQLISGSYTALLEGEVGVELKHDAPDNRHRTAQQQANVEIKAILRKVCRDVDSFAGEYIPPEKNEWSSPQQVENGRQARLLALSLDEIWRSDRIVSFAKIHHEVKGAWRDIYGEFAALLQTLLSTPTGIERTHEVMPPARAAAGAIGRESPTQLTAALMGATPQVGILRSAARSIPQESELQHFSGARAQAHSDRLEEQKTLIERLANDVTAMHVTRAATESDMQQKLLEISHALDAVSRKMTKRLRRIEKRAETTHIMLSNIFTSQDELKSKFNTELRRAARARTVARGIRIRRTRVTIVPPRG